ncbi:GTPase ObgE [Desulfonema magnum]|uniref:GTPase Obg n=1 Tax=Desulfonema magnum TaxID=45655 RepID=A0A975GS00_9BACT|nr:GTPase ObgE [Desulfonema magnum]QTA91541.1 GTPase [Desulfonema magnum]
MKFIDETLITVRSGHGGSGCVSFRRERFVPRGGPDGGDGGKGGDVILETTSRKRTLYHFQFKRDFKARNGQNGQGKQKTGRNADDIIIEIPPGTLVTDAETGKIVKDFVHPDESLIVAKGGRGGQGNRRFKSSTNRTPRFAQPGEPGEELTLRLELKLLADVGIIGLPNAGKSTLTRAVSSATPNVGNYPFTTLTPSLGVVQAGWGEPFVVADIPGLIEGAHKGAGLGIQFLRHIERTRILLHLIDASEIDPDHPLSVYETINTELALYNETLAKKPQIVVLNKLDIPGASERAEMFRAAAKGMQVMSVSAATRDGIEALISQLIQLLDNHS